MSYEQWRDEAKALRIDSRVFIDGARRPARASKVFKTIDPWRESVVAEYAVCEEADIDDAVSAASRAFARGAWSKLSVSERGQVMSQWARLIKAHVNELALCDSLEMGMPITQSMSDVSGAADAVDEIVALRETLPEPQECIEGSLSVTRFEPRGTVLAITPWNFPVSQVIARITPALAMGNSVVLKPSEIAPASALRLADLLSEAGLPDGVLNVVTGPGAPTGALLAADSRFSLIAFTGSGATGAKIQSLAASSGSPRPVLMELGGKSPVIVARSCPDPETLGNIIADGICFNTGQVCAAGSRLLVHRDVADAVIAAAIKAASSYKTGDPLDPQTTMGPLATAAQSDRVTGFVERARAEGLSECPCPAGFELPTGTRFFDDVPASSELAREEVFGPVLAVSRYDGVDEAVTLANASGFGLVATVFSGDAEERQYLIEQLRAGVVTAYPSSQAVAMAPPSLAFEPAGRSGFGCDFGYAGLEVFAQRKLVTFAA